MIIISIHIFKKNKINKKEENIINKDEKDKIEKRVTPPPPKKKKINPPPLNKNIKLENKTQVKNLSNKYPSNLFEIDNEKESENKSKTLVQKKNNNININKAIKNNFNTNNTNDIFKNNKKSPENENNMYQERIGQQFYQQANPLMNMGQPGMN